MNLAATLAISLVATVAAAVLVTRRFTPRSAPLLSVVALTAALAIGLLEAPYLAGLETLCGAVLVPGLLLVGLRIRERQMPESTRTAPAEASRARCIVAGTFAGAAFVALSIAFRLAPTTDAALSEQSAAPPGDAVHVGGTLFGSNVIGVELVAVLIVVSVVAAVRLAARALAHPRGDARTSREST